MRTKAEQKRDEKEHGIEMLRKYVAKGTYVYGVQTDYRNGVSHIRAFVINEGEPADIGLYIASARGIRRDKRGALIGRNRTIEDIRDDVAFAVGYESKELGAKLL